MTIADTAEAVDPTLLDPQRPVAAAVGADATTSSHGLRRLRLGRVGGWLGAVVFVAVLIGAWQIWVSIGDVDTIVAPTPGKVFADLVSDPGVYLSATAATLRTAGLGLLFGTVAGSLVAVAVWWSPLLGAFAGPSLLVGRLVPVVVVIPVVARAIGYGTPSVVVVNSLLTFSFAYVLVGAGLRSVSAIAIEVVTAYGGVRRDLLRKVAIPSAMPALASAVRLGAAAAVLGALASEFLIGTDGLGALFVQTRTDYSQIARSWGVAVVASILSAVLFLSTTHLERLARRRFT